MARLRVATCNMENLFARWRFKTNVDPSQANTRGRVVDQTKFEELGVDDKAITGAAVSEIRADVISFQEVENVDTLKHFRARSLGGRRAYPSAPRAPPPVRGATSGQVTGNCSRHKPR